MTMPRILYGSPGLFDMGGIARYGRAQVHVLRQIVGANRVSVISMLGPAAGGFDEPIAYDATGGGNGIGAKAKFIAAMLKRMAPRTFYWSGHLNYTPLVVPVAAMTQGTAVVNIYGLELWSNRSKLKEACLRRCWVIADCHATLASALSMGVVDKDRSTVIHDPVDVKFFTPGPADTGVAQRYGLQADGRFRVMFLGRLDSGSKHKGPDRLIRAFCSAKLPPGAELVIAGSGNQLANLTNLARECGGAEKVKLIGRVPDKDLPSLFRLASVFALVSQKYPGGGEGIPLTPLEAAACGIPAIVGDEDGSVEVCINEESGLIVSSRDPEAISRALERLSSDRPRLIAMGQAARARAESMFSIERFAAEHESFIDRILSESSMPKEIRA
jgi:glycosyltransferase involved in cell wall biosynthesis